MSFAAKLGFWHRHGLTWGKSDLYYVARLELASATEQIAADTGVGGEISACCWMDVDEFLKTQDHPLITGVLQRVYGLTGSPDGATASASNSERPPVEPVFEMVEHAVQWPGRDPYPTYWARPGGES